MRIVPAHDLAGSDQGGFNDPYVRLFLTPEVDSRKRQTSIHRNDTNPVFNDIFKFPVSHDALKAMSLLLQVFDYDKFSRNDIIGEVSAQASGLCSRCFQDSGIKIFGFVPCLEMRKTSSCHMF